MILIEYTEQHPPMLSNPDMASCILYYWRPLEDASASLGILCKKKARKTRPKPPDMAMGQVITLRDHDESPLVGYPTGASGDVTQFKAILGSYFLPHTYGSICCKFGSTRAQQLGYISHVSLDNKRQKGRHS